MTGRRLLSWADLDDARRGRRPWRLALPASAALAGLIAWIAYEHGATAASRLWLAAAIVATAYEMVTAPFRLYWRHDSALWARLPLPGAALFHVALVRSIRAAVRAAVVVGPAALVIAPGSWDLAGRHLALLGVLTLGAGLLAPATSLGGGALVASGKADALVSAVTGGDYRTPPTGWLGGLPGLAAAGLVILAIASSSWLRGTGDFGVAPAPVVLAATAAVCAVAAIAAWRAAPTVMPAALREVAALDRQQLAHLDIHPPTTLERATMRLLPASARPVFSKDARLVRRRHPLAYVMGSAGLLTQWIFAATAPDGMLAWSAAVVAAMFLYAGLMARRLREPPIEQSRVLAGLPLAQRDVDRAKHGWVVLWIGVYVIPGVAAVVGRAVAG